MGVDRAAHSPDGRDWVVRSTAARPRRGLQRLIAPFGAVPSFVLRVRYVEALHDGAQWSRMTWIVPADRADAVVDQVARQLELGYDRIQPHNAQFLGFD